MATKRSSERRVAHATGRIVATFRDGLCLIQTGRSTRRTIPAAQTAAALGAKLGKALSKPGISRDAVFGTVAARGEVYAYSVLPEDPTKLVRETADGKRTIGRVVGGKFRALRVK